MRTHRLITFAAFLCLCAAQAAGRQPAARPAYLPDVLLDRGPSGAQAPPATPDDLKLAQFAATLLELQLRAVGGLNVQRAAAPCAPLDSAGQRRRVIPVPGATDTYEVRATIGRSSTPQGGVERVLDYDLIKYDGQCVSSVLVHRTEPFTLKTAVESLSLMGDVVRLAFEKELAPPKTVVELVGLKIADPSLESARDALASAVFFKLVEQPNLQARRGGSGEGADYVVSGELSRGPDRAGVLQLNVLRAADGKPFIVKEPFGQDDLAGEGLERLGAKAAGEVSNLVNDLRLRGASGALAPEAEVMQTARVFMCVGDSLPKGCDPNPASAVPLLTMITEGEGGSADALGLLGQAHKMIGDNVSAAEAYDRAAKKAGGGQLQWGYVEKAAGAWYDAQNFPKAAERFERLLAASDAGQGKRTNHHLQLAKSYHFAGERLKGVKAAVAGLRVVEELRAQKQKDPNEDRLEDELEALVRDVGVSFEEIEPSLAVLEANKDIDEVGDEIPKLREVYAKRLVQKAYLSSRRPGGGDAAELLKKFDELPTSAYKLEQFERNTLDITRALVLSRGGDDAGAISRLQQVPDKRPAGDRRAQYYLAQLHFARAERAGRDAGARDYQEVAGILERLSQDADFDHFELLRLANHRLGADKATRELLREMVKRRAADAYHRWMAAEQLYYVCVNHLKDFDCGDEARALLERSTYAGDRAKLYAVELAALRGRHEEALGLLRAGGAAGEALKIHAFYETWLASVAGDEAAAEASARRWLAAKTPQPGPYPNSDWGFDAARQAVEAEPKLAPKRKELLLKMIAAMTDPTQPPPAPDEYFPSAPAAAPGR